MNLNLLLKSLKTTMVNQFIWTVLLLLAFHHQSLFEVIIVVSFWVTAQYLAYQREKLK